MQAQAEFFLSVVNPRQSERVVADHEKTPRGPRSQPRRSHHVPAGDPVRAAGSAVDGLFGKFDQGAAGFDAQRLAGRKYVTLARPVHNRPAVMAERDVAGLEPLAVYRSGRGSRLRRPTRLRSLRRLGRELPQMGRTAVAVRVSYAESRSAAGGRQNRDDDPGGRANPFDHQRRAYRHTAPRYVAQVVKQSAPQ
jgi:hypothetical protein